MLTFIFLFQYTTAHKEPKPRFFSQKGGTQSNPAPVTETLSSIFLPSSYCSSTKMLHSDEWQGTQFTRQGTYSKVILIKRNANIILLAYDFMPEKILQFAYNLGERNIVERSHLQLLMNVSSKSNKKNPPPSLLGTCFSKCVFLAQVAITDNTRQIATVCVL